MTDAKAHPSAAIRPAPKRLLTSMFTPKQRFIYLGLAITWLVSTTWFWLWWVQPEHFLGWHLLIFASIPIVWSQALQGFFLCVLFQSSRSTAPPAEIGEWRVAMIVTKTPSEPFSVLEKTLRAMLAQDYPHDTWLADEDPTEETRSWCARHGVKISCRKGVAAYHRATWPRRTRCKEGNLAYFYDHWGYSQYDFVSQLDADHVPQPGYLREILRPFADDQVGYVSAPSICSANASESWAARTRLHTEAAFHGLFQTGYAGVSSPLCIGSHYAVRTKALKQAGGLGPDLAEDHSTSLMISAAGWRGVHAIDAIAIGDGPESIADMVTQEFQWSRSVVTLLLRHSMPHLRKLSGSSRSLFVFFELWYPLVALTAIIIFVTPIIALLFDVRFVDVTYPDFLLHALPSTLIFIVIAYRIRADGFLRPIDAPALSWEKSIYLAVQWPWVVWGCVMAIWDRISGTFVDFRVTPKGASAARFLPNKVVFVYAGLAVASIAPLFFADSLVDAAGFVLFSSINALLNLVILTIIVIDHIRTNPHAFSTSLSRTMTQISALVCVVGVMTAAMTERGSEGLYALAFGLEPLRLVKAEFSAAGAGKTAQIKLYWDPMWVR